jgi:tetratricopeptide (TPR) repeat protein
VSGKSVLLALVSLWAALALTGQTSVDLSDQARRQKASLLFEQGKRLEALPLLEDLVKTNPRDSAMLVALAACLVEHAATLPDLEGGGKERLRARELLARAWALGNSSPLAMNLAQLLKQLPESGAVKFSDNPAVDQAMRAGEASFSRRDFEDARKHYAKTLELEPGNYSAALFIGNTYDRQNEFAKAAPWYERAIRLDPNVETAYRYYADMLAKKGEMARARTMLIGAAVAEPYNRIVWRELRAWAALNHARIAEILIVVPEARSQAGSESDRAPIWQPYWDAKAHWQADRHNLREESQALTAVAENLEKLKSDERLAGWVRSDQSLGMLLQLHEARLIEPYVLFSLGDAGIARDYDSFRAANRNKLEQYLDQFVVPPAARR